MNPTAPAENSAAVAAAQEELVAAECCVDARVFEDIHSLIMSPAAGGEDRDHSEPSSASSSSVLALDFADITAEDIRNFYRRGVRGFLLCRWLRSWIDRELVRIS